MIKAILNFLKVHRDMIFGNSPVIVQNVFGITSKPFNAVDVVSTSVAKGFPVVQAMMLAPASQRIVAAKGVRVVDRVIPNRPSEHFSLVR